MIIYSWNVNGYRAVIKKDFRDWLDGCGADVVMLQETKAHPDQVDDDNREPDSFSNHYWNWSKKKRAIPVLPVSPTRSRLRCPQGCRTTDSETKAAYFIWNTRIFTSSIFISPTAR